MRPEPLPYLDTVPGWFGPTLMLLGTGSIVYWGVKRLLDVDGSPGRLHALLTAVGVTFVVAGVLGTTGTVGTASIVLFAAGRLVEGGASVRTLRKLYDAVAGSDDSDGDGDGGLRRWLRRSLLLAGIGTASTAVLYALLFAGGTEPLLFELTLVWTVGTFVTAVLGMSWKLGPAGGLQPTLAVGLVSSFGGATVYDYATLGVDLLSVVVGVGAFVCGVVVGGVAVATR